MPDASKEEAQATPPPQVSAEKWNAVVLEPGYLPKMIELGQESYLAAMGTDAKGDAPLVVSALARVVVEAFSACPAEELRAVNRYLSGEGGGIDPGLWEDPRESHVLHRIAEDAQGNAPVPLMNLVVVGHDLEFRIRPDLHRLSWCLGWLVGEGAAYRDEMLKADGEQGSLAYAIKTTQRRIAVLKEPFVANETAELDAYARSWKGDDPDLISLDDLRNWIAHRDFFLTPTIAVLNFHPAPGRRLPLPAQQTNSLRMQLMGLACVFHAFRTMFLASVVGYTGEPQRYDFQGVNGRPTP